MSDCLFRRKVEEKKNKKKQQTNSYHQTLIPSRGGNECVLTKISHNFHCHFNAPTLCGGLQSQRWRKRVGGGRRTSRQWSRERVSGACLVCQSPPFSPPTKPSHAHRWTQSVHTQTSVHVRCSRMLSPHFESLKMWLSKRVGAWKPPAVLQQDRRAYC